MGIAEKSPIPPTLKGKKETYPNSGSGPYGPIVLKFVFNEN